MPTTSIRTGAGAETGVIFSTFVSLPEPMPFKVLEPFSLYGAGIRAETKAGARILYFPDILLALLKI